MRRPAVDEPGAGLQVQFRRPNPIQRTSAPSAPSAGSGPLEQPATFRVQPDQFDNVVQSTSAQSTIPLYRKVTVDLDGLGREERMEPVHDPPYRDPESEHGEAGLSL